MKGVDAAIKSKLASGTALTHLLGGTLIYNAVAPRGSARPYVVFSYVSGGDDNDTRHRTLSVTYQVVALADTIALASEIAAEVDTLLHGGTLSASGYTNYATDRQGVIQFVEEDPALAQIWHVGAEYLFRFD